MTKILPVLFAASLLASPAYAADSIKVSLVNKTPEQIDADIRHAARIVCGREASSPLYWACVEATVREARASIERGAVEPAAKLALAR